MNARLACAVLVLVASSALAAGPEEASPADFVAVAGQVAPSLVRVEYTLRPDKGEDPVAGGYTRAACPVNPYSAFDADAPVREERPLEVEGFLLEPALVLSPDPMIHPRFIESIAVRFGDQVVPAKPVRYAHDQNALFLQLENPLAGAKPLAFDAEAKAPFLAVTYGYGDEGWTVGVSPIGSEVSVTETGLKVRGVPLCCLIVTEKGQPVGMSLSGTLPVDDSWKGPPEKWPTLSADEVASLADKVAKRADQAVLRVQLGFRSPKKEEGGRAQYSRGGDDDQATERHVPGILVGPDRILVLANLAQKVTARLERIKVFPPEGEPVAAAFEGTLKDYGGFIATLKKPLDGAVKMTAGDIRRFDKVLVLGADVRIQGENRVVYVCRRRITEFNRGWKRHVYPELPGNADNVFLFDDEASLVAFPVARRPKAGQQERGSSENPKLTAATQLAPVLGALAQNVDLSNVPLSEEEENRIAWLGALLQPMDRELARLNKVSHLTQDGQTGAIVSYVYPASPADKAGVKAGWILLRLHVEDFPKPLEIKMENDRSGDWEFPWERLDELPEEYYDRLPAPWQPAENSFTRMITDIGFGKKYRAEFVADGQTVFKDFEVVQSPPHFGAAPRFKSDALGITVRDMTYEVRRYLQKEPNDPGIVISKVEPGSKASVAGIKPYETITHVNEQPVANVKDFERLIAGQQELRLAVKRMVQGRVVKITLTGGPEKPQEPPKAAPAEKPAPEAPPADK
ncbi:MAG: PDZ domain-containing protein [Planctomycetota bacterium]|nr:PDZ domain-containing protein [Planctomycetota bacterium]